MTERPITATSERPRRRLPRLKTVAGALILALIPTGAGVGTYLNGDPLFLPKTGISFLTETSCPPTPVDEVIKVDRLVNSNYPRPSITDYGQQIAFAKEQAEINGLTLVDPFPFEEKLNESKSIDEVLKVLNEFSANFGFQFGFPTEVKPISFGPFSYSVANKEELTLDEFKTNAYGFIDVFALIPTEIVKVSKINKVNFVNIPDNQEAAGAYSYINGEVYLAYNKSSVYQFSDAIHEFGHGIDRQICGAYGSERDSEFDYLNNSESSGFSYGPTESTQRYVIRSYGSSNIREDKATILEYLIPGFAEYDKYGPALQEKIILLLARLDVQVPGFANYLKAISAKGQI